MLNCWWKFFSSITGHQKGYLTRTNGSVKESVENHNWYHNQEKEGRLNDQINGSWGWRGSSQWRWGGKQYVGDGEAERSGSSSEVKEESNFEDWCIQAEDFLF